MDEPREIGDWQRVSQLGSGAFGIVTLWKNKTSDEYFALKKCKSVLPSSLTPRQIERWKQEVAVMKRIKNDYIVSFKDLPQWLLQELNNYNPTKLPLLSMEYCSKGNLRIHLRELENRRGLRESTVRCILSDISQAIQYLHAMDITHRDIKPENIVMQNCDDRPEKTVYKIIDLGYAKELASLANSFVGTLPYLAPEIFQQGKYTKSVDYWSFGITAYEIITGELPFLPKCEPPKRFVHIRDKSDDIICIFMKNGRVHFSREILRKLWITSCFQKNIEDWLRLVLQFDGAKRGIYNEINAISQIQEILLKKIVKVLFVYDLTMYSYEITSISTFRDLKDLVKTEKFSYDDLFILHVGLKDFYSDDDNILESIENIDHTSEFYIFNREVYMDVKKPVSFPSVLEKLYTDRIDFSPQEILDIACEFMYFIWEEEIILDYFYRAMHNLINYMEYILEVLLSEKLFVKIRKESQVLITKIDCYNVINEDILRINLEYKSHSLKTYRKLLRQTKELIENVNGMTEKFLLLNNKKADIPLKLEEVRKFDGKELKLTFSTIIDDCKRVIINNMQNVRDGTWNDVDDPPDYVKLRCNLNRFLKIRRNSVVTNKMIGDFVFFSIKLAKKSKKHHTWCMALDRELFRISQELQENQLYINKKLSTSNNNENSLSVTIPNDLTGAMETKLLVDKNMQLRYAIQEKMDETAITLQNIHQDILKQYNGVTLRYGDI